MYIPVIDLPILLWEICGTDPNIQIAHRHMNVQIGTVAAQFPEKEYINGIFIAVWPLFPPGRPRISRSFVILGCTKQKFSFVPPTRPWQCI
jgi:hypothetical protein